MCNIKTKYVKGLECLVRVPASREAGPRARRARESPARSVNPQAPRSPSFPENNKV